MPFYGPFSLGETEQFGAGLESAVQRLRGGYPGLQGLTAYAGAPGRVSGLGFTHPRRDLFPGQPPSSVNALFQAPGPVGSTVAAPESITSALAQAIPPGAVGGGETTGPVGAPAESGPGGFTAGLSVGGFNIGGNLGALGPTQGPIASTVAGLTGLSPTTVGRAATVAGALPGVGPVISGLNLVDTIALNMQRGRIAGLMNQGLFGPDVNPPPEDIETLQDMQLGRAMAAMMAADAAPSTANAGITTGPAPTDPSMGFTGGPPGSGVGTVGTGPAPSDPSMGFTGVATDTGAPPGPTGPPDAEGTTGPTTGPPSAGDGGASGK